MAAVGLRGPKEPIRVAHSTLGTEFLAFLENTLPDAGDTNVRHSSSRNPEPLD